MSKSCSKQLSSSSHFILLHFPNLSHVKSKKKNSIICSCCAPNFKLNVIKYHEQYFRQSCYMFLSQAALPLFACAKVYYNAFYDLVADSLFRMDTTKA